MLVMCTGILSVDLIAADLPKISSPGEITYVPKGIEVHIGGHCANVSIDLRKLGVREGDVSSTGAVGEDIFGNLLERLLKESEVKTHLQRVSEAGTSKDLILVVSGEDRRFHVDIGANLYLNPEYIIDVLEEEKPKIFYAGGVGITKRLDEHLLRVLQKARDMGCITFIDPVKPYMHGWRFIKESMKWINIFHCNADESLELTGRRDPREAAVTLREKGADIVVVSLGEEGLVAASKEAIFEMSAFKVPVVDPTGAGDALSAGIIHGILKVTDRKKLEISSISEEDLITVLMEGEAAGASCVTGVGTTTAVTMENVSRILKEQGEHLRSKGLKIRSLR